VNPVQFEQEHGLRAFNLGVLGPIGARAYSTILRHYLAHHRKPRLVCLCIYPAEFDAPDDEITHDAREQFMWCYGSEVESQRPRHSDATAFYIGQGLWNVCGALSGGRERRLREPMRWPATLSYREQQSQSDALRGGMTWFRPPVMDEAEKRNQSSKDHFRVLLATEFKSSLGALEFECRCHGIQLVVRLTPTLQGAHSEALHPLSESSTELALAYPAMTICRPALLEYPPREFTDGAHLNSDGARRFTTQVGDDIARAMAAKPTRTD
jgi:hypothetical protein